MDLESLNGEYCGYEVKFWLKFVIHSLDNLKVGTKIEVEVNEDDYKSIQDCVGILNFLYNYLELCSYEDYIDDEE